MKKCLIALMMLTVIVGCAKEDGRKVISFWLSEPPKEPVGMTIDRLVKEYNSEKKEYKIVTTYETWDYLSQKLLTSIAGEVPPDIVLLDRFITASFAHRGALLDLTEFAKKDNIKRENFYNACWNECVYQGKLWAMPHHTDVRALYYRVDDFEEVGLDPERPPKNWDELYEYAKKLTKWDKEGRIERIGFLPYLGNAHLHMWAWLNGGRFMVDNKITCNGPKIVEALEWMVKFQDLYGRKNVIGTLEAFGSRDLDPFIIGRLSMKVDGDWNVAVMKKFGPNVKYKIASPPPPKEKSTLSWSGGFALVIPKGAKNANEAWDFIKFLVDMEPQLKISTESARIPALKKAAEGFSSKHPQKKVFFKLMKVTKYRPVTPIANYYWDQLVKATEYALIKQKTPKEALDEAAENTQKELDAILKETK